VPAVCIVADAASSGEPFELQPAIKPINNKIRDMSRT
jgi:hypothetical protein